MRILIVCSGNAENFNFKINQAFIYDQVEAIKQESKRFQFDYFFIKGQGLIGYMATWKKLKIYLKSKQVDCIHAHFAYSALLANLQRKIPVVSTFHGSDINNLKIRIPSLFVELLSKRSIYVSHFLLKKAFISIRKKDSVIPCGINLEIFKRASKTESRQKLGLQPDKKYILFSSCFDNTIKNYPLAKSAIEKLNDPNIIVLEMKNYTRQQVALLLNAVDVALMTSYKEGSPQFIKEAMACNCPIVTTNVGDVKEVIANTQGCYISSFEIEDVTSKLRLALEFGQRTNGRNNIMKFDNKIIANKIIDVYKSIYKSSGINK